MSEINEKSSGCTYNIADISITKCPRVPNLVLNKYKDIKCLPNYPIWKKSYNCINDY